MKPPGTVLRWLFILISCCDLTLSPSPVARNPDLFPTVGSISISPISRNPNSITWVVITWWIGVTGIDRGRGRLI